MGLISQVVAALQFRMAGIEVFEGPEHLGEHAAPPRIVIVATTDRYGPPDARWVGPPRALYTRKATIDLHLWGETTDSIEDDLLPRVINALRIACGGPSFTLSDGRWPQQTGARIVQKGRLYVLPVTFLAAVAEPTGVVGAGGEATIISTDTADTSLPIGT